MIFYPLYIMFGGGRLVDEGKKLRLHAFISGRVQGVFFRVYTKEKALMLGLTGWVRNLRDGRVEVVAEGNEDNLRKLLQWLQKEGSPQSIVKKVDWTWFPATGEFRTFEIAPTA